MKSRNVRITTALVTFGLFVALAGLIAPTAFGATRYELRFVETPESHQPQDTKVNALIRAADLNSEAGLVQVEVVESGTDTRATSIKGPVGFTLQPGAGYASGRLDVIPQPLMNGVATFGLTTTGKPTLSIGEENEPQFTDYALVPVTTKGPLITGDPSDPFDVWEDGDSCTGGTDPCKANLRGVLDSYTLETAGTLGASELPGALPGLTCPGQKEVFAGRVFSHATTDPDDPGPEVDPEFIPDPVKLVSTVTKKDWQASANNGQAHADWCIGLISPDAWERNGADYSQIDTNLDGTDDLYVALAPRCPVANPFSFAPCIVSQTGDGKGGSISIGWLTGGDPPRKT